MKVSLFSPDYESAWDCNLSRRQVSAVNNDRLVSCGLVIGEDVTAKTVKQWIAKGIAVPTDAAKARHSGCQSRCILRGDSTCQW